MSFGPADLCAAQARRGSQASCGGKTRVLRAPADHKRPPAWAVGARAGDERVRVRGHWSRLDALSQTSGAEAPPGRGGGRHLIVNREDKGAVDK